MIQSFQISLSKALYSNVKKAEKIIDKFEKVYKYIETNDFNIPPQSVQNKNTTTTRQNIARQITIENRTHKR